MNVLLAEDDPELSRQIIAMLEEEGHRAIWRETGTAALKAITDLKPDVVVLDVGLPELDGFEIVERLRASKLSVPVLFLTARESVTDRVRGLKAGGDDYLTKPFSGPELMARLEALHRRASAVAPTERKLRDWILDPLQRRLRRGNEVVDLQPREWTLLEVLMANEDRVLTKKFLLEKVWDIQFDPGTNVVDAMVCRLRRKIDPSEGTSHIQTVRGKGYVFKAIP